MELSGCLFVILIFDTGGGLQSEGHILPVFTTQTAATTERNPFMVKTFGGYCEALRATLYENKGSGGNTVLEYKCCVEVLC